MPHPKDSEIYPLETVVRIIKTGEFAIIKKHVFLFEERNFLHYLGHIEQRTTKEDHYFVLYHHEVELEALPTEGN